MKPLINPSSERLLHLVVAKYAAMIPEIGNECIMGNSGTYKDSMCRRQETNDPPSTCTMCVLNMNWEGGMGG